MISFKDLVLLMAYGGQTYKEVDLNTMPPVAGATLLQALARRNQNVRQNLVLCKLCNGMGLALGMTQCGTCRGTGNFS